MSIRGFGAKHFSVRKKTSATGTPAYVQTSMCLGTTPPSSRASLRCLVYSKCQESSLNPSASFCLASDYNERNCQGEVCALARGMRGMDPLPVSVTLRWFPVSVLRKGVCLCVTKYSFCICGWAGAPTAACHMSLIRSYVQRRVSCELAIPLEVLAQVSKREVKKD